MTVVPFPPHPADPDAPALSFLGYFKGLVANPSSDGEITVKIGVPHDQANAAWPLRELNGLTLRFDVTVPPMDATWTDLLDDGDGL